MIVVDSSMWLEYFIDGKISDILEEILSEPEQIVIPTIIITEVYKKLSAVRDEDYAQIYISQFKSYEIVDLDYELSILSAKTGKEYKLPLADSIIYATAIKKDAVLYTMDKHFKGLPHVEYFEK